MHGQNSNIVPIGLSARMSLQYGAIAEGIDRKRDGTKHLLLFSILLENTDGILHLLEYKHDMVSSTVFLIIHSTRVDNYLYLIYINILKLLINKSKLKYIRYEINNNNS